MVDLGSIANSWSRPDDLEPRALARYLEGFFELEGAPVTSAVERAVVEMERSGGLAAPDAEPTPPADPTITDFVVGLEVRVAPASMCSRARSAPGWSASRGLPVSKSSANAGN